MSRMSCYFISLPLLLSFLDVSREAMKCLVHVVLPLLLCYLYEVYEQFNTCSLISHTDVYILSPTLDICQKQLTTRLIKHVKPLSGCRLYQNLVLPHCKLVQPNLSWPRTRLSSFNSFPTSLIRCKTLIYPSRIAKCLQYVLARHLSIDILVYINHH